MQPQIIVNHRVKYADRWVTNVVEFLSLSRRPEYQYHGKDNYLPLSFRGEVPDYETMSSHRESHPSHIQQSYYQSPLNRTHFIIYLTPVSQRHTHPSISHQFSHNDPHLFLLRSRVVIS